MDNKSEEEKRKALMLGVKTATAKFQHAGLDFHRRGAQPRAAVAPALVVGFSLFEGITAEFNGALCA